MTTVALPAPPAAAAAEPSAAVPPIDRDLVHAGIGVILAAFGFFGTWAALAPLNGAVVVHGTVAVEAERKTVQHLEGGIVRRILVQPGSRVRQGQPLVELEDVQADAAVSALRAQLDGERARGTRLAAEAALTTQLDFPPDIVGRQGDAGVARILETERRLFGARRRSVDDQIAHLRTESAHIRAEIASLEQQTQAASAGLGFAREQLQLNEQLQRETFVSGARVLEFKGQVADREQRRSETAAQAAQARQKIAQNDLKIEALRHQYTRDAADELRQAERRIDELRERLRPNLDALQRLTLVAPIDGEVVDLRVHTVGGVIAPREPLMQIVPAAAPLVVKAKARTEDITQLQPGAAASVQLIAYKRRTTPEVPGRLSYVSADMLLEPTPAGPVPYYEVHLTVDREALEHAGHLAMLPGMPVEAYVQTEQRTLIEYLLQPITQALRRAGRER